MSPTAELSAQSFTPDPATVVRYGPAYKYPQHGWLVVHIEGEPYERGVQHGRLLAEEIIDHQKSLAAFAIGAAITNGNERRQYYQDRNTNRYYYYNYSDRQYYWDPSYRR